MAYFKYIFRKASLALALIAAFLSAAAFLLGPSPGRTSWEASPAVKYSFLNFPLYFEENRGQTDSRVKFISRGSGYGLYLTQTEAVLALSTPFDAQSLTRGGAGGRKTSVVRMMFEGANPKAPVSGEGFLPGKSNYFIGNDPAKWQSGISQYSGVKWKGLYPGIDLVFYGVQRNQPFETRPQAAPQGICRGQMEYDYVVAPGADPNAIRLKVEGAIKITLDGGGNMVLRTEGGDLTLKKPVCYQNISGSREPVEGRFAMLDDGEVGFEIDGYDPTRLLVIDPVLEYSTYLGGSLMESGSGIAVDDAGCAYVAGYTRSLNYPTANAIQGSFGGGAYDAFVAKLNPAGNSLVYSTYLGGAGDDLGLAIAVDGSGNACVVGNTQSSNFPTQNPIQASLSGYQDFFVAKVGSAGSSLVYSTYLGGSAGDYGNGVAVDASGNAYIAGNTGSIDFPTQNPFQTTHGGGGMDAFVCKVNPAGTALVYSSFLGGNDYELGCAIAVDASGYACLTGETASINFPTQNPLQVSSGGGMDAYVSKINGAGTTMVYSTYLGGTANDIGYGIAVDNAGNAYVTGAESSSNFPTRNPIQVSYGGGSTDAFVAKIDAAGTSLVYSTYLGGSGDDNGYGIKVDGTGNAFVAGFTSSTDFPTLDSLRVLSVVDAFITGIRPAGTGLVYSTLLGGSNADGSYGLALDSAGSVYTTGYTSSTDFPMVNPLQAGYGSGLDAFISKIGVPTPTPTETATLTHTSTPIPTASATPTATPIRSCEVLFISGNFFRVSAQKEIPIRLWLCEPGRASLTVYNSAGERVKLLRSWALSSETYIEARWDGTNDGGAPVADGIYLIHFEGSRGADTRKLVVVR